MKKLHLITGLPRSGTTLLSTILKQNPRFEASISNPLARITKAIVQESTAQVGYKHECPPEKTRRLVKDVIESYYADSGKEVAFNTNRGWGLQLNAMKDIYPDLKVILCVRDIGWILDSFETLQRNNPFINSNIFGPGENVNVYSRCNTLLRSDRVLGFAYDCVKQTLSSEHKQSVMLIDYQVLASEPARALDAIYNFIGEPAFKHDFNDVEAAYDEFDEDLQLPGLHKTRKKVEYVERETIIPGDIWAMTRGMEFWKPPQEQQSQQQQPPQTLQQLKVDGKNLKI
jgi:sulfotransferase